MDPITDASEIHAEEQDVPVDVISPVTRKRKARAKTKTQDQPPATKKKPRGSRSKTTRYTNDIEALEPKRRREIGHIVRRLVRDPTITNAFISSAVRCAKNSQAKIDRIGEYKEAVVARRDRALENSTGDEKKNARTVKLAEAKLARLDAINETTFLVCLRPQDDQFLSKFKVHKPLSGYMLYAKSIRPEVRSRNPEFTFGEMGAEIGKSWKSLSDEERSAWVSKKAPDVGSD